jgi:hypothetical protein
VARHHSRRFPALPPGRKPGPQSRRGVPGLGNLYTLLLSGVIMVGIGVWGVLHPGRVAPAVWAFSFAAMALPLFIAAWYLNRRDRPRWQEAREVSIRVEPLEVRRGEELTVEVGANSPPAGGGPLEVGLVCVESYDVKRTFATRRGTSEVRETEQAVERASWVLAEGSANPVRLRVPIDAPPSYEGSCLSFSWRISGRVRLAGDGDLRTDQPIWVLP